MFAQQGEATSPVLAMLHVDADRSRSRKRRTTFRQTAPPAVTTPAEPASDRLDAAGAGGDHPRCRREPERNRRAAAGRNSPAPSNRQARNTGRRKIRQARDPGRGNPAQARGRSRRKPVRPLPPTKPRCDIERPDSGNRGSLRRRRARRPQPHPKLSRPHLNQRPQPTSTDTFSTKIATLGGPPVTIEPPPAKAAVAKPDKNAIRKREQARRALGAAGLRCARAAAAQIPQQPTDPFAQPAAAGSQPSKPR